VSHVRVGVVRDMDVRVCATWVLSIFGLFSFIMLLFSNFSLVDNSIADSASITSIRTVLQYSAYQHTELIIHVQAHKCDLSIFKDIFRHLRWHLLILNQL